MLFGNIENCFMSKWIINYCEGDNNVTSINQRKSISLLLGAGFSAPMGYPIGNDLNERLLNFDDEDVDFAPSGELAISTDGQKPQFQMYGIAISIKNVSNSVNGL